MMHCRYFDTTRNGNHSSFLTPTVIGGRCPFFLSNIHRKWPTPAKKCQLWQISTHNSTVRGSEKSSITMNIKSTTGFPTSYRWSVYVTPKSRKGGSKSDFFRFWNKSQLQSNKVCYKVSLCENFQRQSCSMAIPLSNGAQILLKKVNVQRKI